MIASSSHHLIMASRVTKTAVFNSAGERIGHVEDLSIHKVSGQVIYA
jgi:sporulation protein YlmC with PRC-barrel domain